MNTKETFYQDKENCNIPFTHVMDEIPESLAAIDELYGAADVLSIYNAQLHQRIIFLISFIATILTISFLLYDEAELFGLIFACLAMIFSLSIINKISRRLECHKKYLEYRVLAETLRVQFFLSMAGITKPVSEILPWFIKKAIPFVEEILLTLPEVGTGEKRPIIDFWIRDQKSYHESALIKSINKDARNERITYIVLYATIIAYVFGVLFEIFVLNHYSLGIDENFVRTILKIVMGTLSAITLFTGSYYGKMSLSEVIDDHKRMISLYEKVENEVLEVGETDELLLYLAHEFLIENSTWYSYQSKNKPEFITG